MREQRSLLLTFVVGALTGVLLSTLAVRGWPVRPEDDLDGDVLVVLSGRDESENRQRQRLIATWNRLHPEKSARIEELPAVADEQLSEMRRRAQSGERDVDVFNLDVTWTAEFAENDWIRPLPGVDDTGFLDQPLETCRYRDKIWALPFNTDAGLLFYRPGHLKDRGIAAERADVRSRPPRSWDTLTRLIDTAFAGPLPVGDRLEAGYAAQFGDYEGLTVNAMEAIWAADGEVVDSDGEVRLDSEEASDALQQLADGFRTPRVILPEARRHREENSTRAFRDRRVLFMRNWPVAYRQLTGPADEASAVVTGRPSDADVEVAPLPGPSVLGGQNLAVARESRHPEAARELVEFLTSEASQQILFQDGGLPATRSRIYEDPQIRARHRYAATLLTAVRRAKLRPVTPYYGRFSEVFRQIVIEVLDTGRDITERDVRRLEAALEGT